MATNEFQFALCVSWITFLATLPSRRMAQSPVPYGVVTPLAGTVSGLAGDLGLVAESFLIFPTPPRTAPTAPSTSPLKAIAYTEIPVGPFIDF
jgi:hypothetical protein